MSTAEYGQGLSIIDTRPVIDICSACGKEIRGSAPGYGADPHYLFKNGRSCCRTVGCLQTLFPLLGEYILMTDLMEGLGPYLQLDA